MLLLQATQSSEEQAFEPTEPGWNPRLGLTLHITCNTFLPLSLRLLIHDPEHRVSFLPPPTPTSSHFLSISSDSATQGPEWLLCWPSFKGHLQLAEGAKENFYETVAKKK